jgi:hypothetical protein
MTATVWACRHLHERDPLAAASEALRQEVVARAAQGLGLEVEYERDGDWVDFAARGPHLSVLTLLRRLQGQGITGLTVDVHTPAAWQALCAAGLDFELVDLTAEGGAPPPDL